MIKKEYFCTSNNASMNCKKVSIIVPVYQAEKYVEKCFNSLLDQSLSEIEVIAVDDKGKDRSMEIVRRIQSEHPKGGLIQIVEMPQNSGAAAARNKGLEYAGGEYVAFVDSDDWCEPNMYEDLFNEAHVHQYDWCFGNAIKEYANGKTEVLRQIPLFNGELSPTIRKKILTHFAAYFSTSIYKKNFLTQNDIQFPLYKFSEDSYFLWMVVMYAERLGYIDKIFYHYIVQSNSVSNIYDSNKHLQKIEVFTLLINRLKIEGKYIDYQDELDYLYIKKGFLIPLSIYCIYNKKISREKVKEFFKTLNETIPNYRNNPYLRRNKKLSAIIKLAKNYPKCFSVLIKIYSQDRRESF